MENIDKQQMMVANEKLHSFYNRVILKKVSLPVTTECLRYSNQF